MRWQIKQAWKHATEKGPGIPQEKTVQRRIHPPMAKVNHFVYFLIGLTSIKMWLTVQE